MYIFKWHICVHVYSYMAYVCVHVYSYMAYVCVHDNIYIDEVYVNILFVIIAALNIFAPPGEVCSGDMATSSCSRVGDLLEWSYDRMRIVILSDRSGASTIVLVDGISFTVTLTFLNFTVTTSNITFTATQASDGKNLSCAGANLLSRAAIRVVTDGKLFGNTQLLFWTKLKKKCHTYHLN